MKWLKWLSVAGAMMLLALTLSVSGGTAAAAPISKLGTNNPAMVSTFTLTFTIHHNGAAVLETCETYTNLYRTGQAYPGQIQAIGYVIEDSCIPYAARSCQQQVKIQMQNSRTGAWNDDGTGPKKTGCAGPPDASIRTNDCSSTIYTLSYRPVGTYYVIDTNGDILGPKEVIGPTLNVKRIC